MCESSRELFADYSVVNCLRTVCMSTMVGVSSEIAFLCGISLSSSLVLSGLPGIFFQKELISSKVDLESE